MIKIKDYIFNEDGILNIKENENNLIITFRDLCSHEITLNATFNDIEWNYNSQERQYNEETEQLISSLQNKKYKLQEELNTLNKLNQQNLKDRYLLQQRINKAIDFIKENTEYLDYEKGEVFECEGYRSNRVAIIRTSVLLNILNKGSEKE